MRYPSQQVARTAANLKSAYLSPGRVLMELVIQFLDELEDWLLIIGRIWQTIAWRIARVLAGALGLLMVTVVATLPH